MGGGLLLTVQDVQSIVRPLVTKILYSTFIYQWAYFQWAYFWWAYFWLTSYGLTLGQIFFFCSFVSLWAYFWWAYFWLTSYGLLWDQKFFSSVLYYNGLTFNGLTLGLLLRSILWVQIFFWIQAKLFQTFTIWVLPFSAFLMGIILQFGWDGVNFP